jgi:chemosensory pili system protein ChpA (sensor histidine kinase/response regulator)
MQENEETETLTGPTIEDSLEVSALLPVEPTADGLEVLDLTPLTEAPDFLETEGSCSLPEIELPQLPMPTPGQLSETAPILDTPPLSELPNLLSALPELPGSGDLNAHPLPEPPSLRKEEFLPPELPPPLAEEELAEELPVVDVPPAPAPTTQEEIAPELLEVFQLEAAEHLRTIQTLLPGLEQQPENKDALQEIRRSAHTLKGAAGMVGFRNVTQLAHRMEDALDLLYDGTLALTPELLQILCGSADALEDLAAGRPADLEPLYRGYTAFLGQQKESTPARPPESAEAVPQPVAGEVPNEARETAPKFVERRVRFAESLDALVKLVSEQVIARTVFEQRMADFLRLLNELQPSTERLRRVSHRLETQYEASALSGGSGQPGHGGLHNRLQHFFQSHGFDALEFDRYSEFHLLTRELAETASDIQTVVGELGHLLGDFDSYLTQQARLTNETEDRLTRLRMVPLATLAGQLQRTVRQVATARDKKVTLVLEGENTGLDKNVLEAMTEPLMHLLRNAVDHGIEPAELRQAQAKPAHGEIRLRASHEGSQVVLRISDDGVGLDPDLIRLVARQRGLVSAAAETKMTDQEALALIFQTGFSTAGAVNEISGRGVGLDIVKARVTQLKGTLAVDSQLGRGTTFTIRLPLTLAIARALMVKAHQETFAIPLSDIRQILRLERDTMESVGQESVVRVAGRVYPVVQLGRALGLRQPADESVARPPVVILNTGERDVALVVDHLLGGREIVVKNLGSHLKKVRGVSGATLLGDGNVVLILNPADLAREQAPTPSHRPLPAPAAWSTDRGKEDWTILIVDDSPSVRRVVAGVIQRAGWKPATAKNGLEALEMLQQSPRLPDLILLDVEMPRMDGYELLSTLQANPAYCGIPVVMLTSRSGEKHRKKAYDLGASDYLVKPYEVETLLTRIRSLVGRTRRAATV